jgi:hypothetical protein
MTWRDARAFTISFAMDHKVTSGVSSPNYEATE